MIERADHRTGYTVIDNRVIRDGRLSPRARFLLILMLSMADEWRFSIRGLAQVAGLGTGAVTTLLKELMEYGYVSRAWERRENGTFGSCQYTVREIPAPVNADSGESPDTQQPDTGKGPEQETAPAGEMPDTAQGHIHRIPDTAAADPGERDTLRNNKERKNTKRERAKPASPPSLDEVRDYCREQGYDIDPERFVDYYEARGWMLGKARMKSWQAAVRTWAGRERPREPTPGPGDRGEVPELDLW
ncbi:MAG: helix-turn-helix domain-containing protein [Clostridiales bacterium]|nr:helix-turn-helix domain-containing protein [Clostridiales bacterium]